MEPNSSPVINPNNESDLTDKIANILKNKVESPENIVSSKEIIEEDAKQSQTEEIIKTANNKFLLEVLSPEIKNNEAKKRSHKDILLISVAVFLAIQFAMVFVFSGYTLFSIIDCHKLGKPFDITTLQLLLGFISAYITAVVVELIAILKYIVTNVFDTSIAGLVEMFRDK